MMTASKLATLFDQKLQHDAEIVIDLSEIHTADSAALALLLEWQRQALRAGARLIVHNIPSRIQNLARMYGVDLFLISGMGEPHCGQT